MKKQSRIISNNFLGLRISEIDYKKFKTIKEKKQTLLKYLLRVIFLAYKGVNLCVLSQTVLLMK